MDKRTRTSVKKIVKKYLHQKVDGVTYSFTMTLNKVNKNRTKEITPEQLKEVLKEMISEV